MKASGIGPLILDNAQFEALKRFCGK